MRTKKPKIGENAYRMRITLVPEKSPMMGCGKRNMRLAKKKNAPSRDVVMLESHNLYQFAETIIQSFLFDFDYGDGWHFCVERVAARESEREVRYPLFFESPDDAPEQYPNFE
ncbi:MAG: hypothetical protein AAB390_01780 [Patescibacteria group bacterium]